MVRDWFLYSDSEESAVFYLHVSSMSESYSCCRGRNTVLTSCEFIPGLIPENQ